MKHLNNMFKYFRIHNETKLNYFDYFQLSWWLVSKYIFETIIDSKIFGSFFNSCIFSCVQYIHLSHSKPELCINPTLACNSSTRKTSAHREGQYICPKETMGPKNQKCSIQKKQDRPTLIEQIRKVNFVDCL